MVHTPEPRPKVVALARLIKSSESVKEIAEIVVRELGLLHVAFSWTGGVAGGGWKGDVRRMVLGTAKLRGTSWLPKYSSAEAVVQAVQDLRANR